MNRRKQFGYTLAILIGFVIIGFFVFPYHIPNYPTSTVLNDREGNLLSASIASDGQWRFPLTDSVPKKLEICLLTFEDEYFYNHPGINPLSIARAAKQNFVAGKVVSGASTLTMQLARMLRSENRNYYQKIIEMLLALRIEAGNSKTEILKNYASLAPFGGNVVGIDAASWRYYGRPAYLLSWAECATLAVLPNDPGSIYPGVAEKSLRKKRDFLLYKLLENETIDSLTYQLSISEPIPSVPFPIPQKATHLLTTLLPKNRGKQLNTNLSGYWQNITNKTIARHHTTQKANGVENMAAMVVNLRDGKVLAYVGNTADPQADGFRVDVIQRPRSSGSILKPLLYAHSLERGTILPQTLLTDIPSYFGGYSPKNFNLGYEGMIKANQALSRSLNIPFVHLLRTYTYEQFHQDLKNLGLSTLSRSPGHYGLSLILGGAEVKLWDLAQVYFSLYRKLANEPNLKIKTLGQPDTLADVGIEEINIWHTFNAMSQLARTGADANWRNFSSSQRIAWKTGTSFGLRDAWAVGINGEVLVAVWVGNADGEGRAGLIGSQAAGPILNELIRNSAYNPGWLNDLQPMGIEKTICVASGMLANEYCPETKTQTLGQNAELTGLCSFHQLLWVDASEQYIVNRSCYDLKQAHQKSFFILPPQQSSFYRKNHADYIGRPSVLFSCTATNAHPVAITYPTPNARIFIPKELAGEYGQLIAEASHQNLSSTIYWHLNDAYIGETTNEHKQALQLPRGKYTITVMDQSGLSASQIFEIISDMK